MTSLLNEVLTPAGVYDLDVRDEDCAECDKPLADNGGEELAGLIGEDKDGLPGFLLMHGPCLTNRLLRLL